MPTPKPNEKKEDFIARCIPYVMKHENIKDKGHAWQKCNGIWKQNKKKKGQALVDYLKK